MPLYDFICTKCGHAFEHKVPAELKHYACPECPYFAYRLPAAPNFAIKGFNEKNGYGSR